MITAPFNENRKTKQRQRAHDLWLAENTAHTLSERLLDIKKPFYSPAQINWYGKDAQLPGNNVTCDLPNLAKAVSEGTVKSNASDLLVSNLSLHWVNDLPGFLWATQHILEPDGLLLATMLGGETLMELRAVLTEAETQLCGGASPRVAPMIDLRDAAGLLQRAGFALPVADRERIPVTFDNLHKL